MSWIGPKTPAALTTMLGGAERRRAPAPAGDSTAAGSPTSVGIATRRPAGRRDAPLGAASGVAGAGHEHRRMATRRQARWRCRGPSPRLAPVTTAIRVVDRSPGSGASPSPCSGAPAVVRRLNTSRSSDDATMPSGPNSISGFISSPHRSWTSLCQSRSHASSSVISEYRNSTGSFSKIVIWAMPWRSISATSSSQISSWWRSYSASPPGCRRIVNARRIMCWSPCGRGAAVVAGQGRRC